MDFQQFGGEHWRNRQSRIPVRDPVRCLLQANDGARLWHSALFGDKSHWKAEDTLFLPHYSSRWVCRIYWLLASYRTSTCSYYSIIAFREVIYIMLQFICNCRRWTCECVVCKCQWKQEEEVAHDQLAKSQEPHSQTEMLNYIFLKNRLHVSTCDDINFTRSERNWAKERFPVDTKCIWNCN